MSAPDPLSKTSTNLHFEINLPSAGMFPTISKYCSPCKILSRLNVTPGIGLSRLLENRLCRDGKIKNDGNGAKFS